MNKPSNWESMTQFEKEKWTYMNSIPTQAMARETASETFTFTISKEKTIRIRGATSDNVVRCDLVMCSLDREIRTEMIFAAREFEETLRKIVAGDCNPPVTEEKS